MCGIAGWIDWERDVSQERQLLERMNETMVCRGPDAEGYWLSRRAGICHRRLSVIDPEGGAQPMVRHLEGRHRVITYNGELYNMDELRQQLIECGHRLQTRSDTELIMAAYDEWGVEVATHLNGIFAFAIWDEREESLYMARDRIGVKPLFFARRGSGILFASELKTLLAHPAVEPIVDGEGLAEVLALGPSRTPGHGVFKGVEELRPGYWLKTNGDQCITRSYWQLESGPHTDSFDNTVERVRYLFQDAVTRQLVSDVPLGTMLSGGLDSSAISAYAAKHYRNTGRGVLNTYSVDYQDNERYFTANEFQPNPDAPWIRRMTSYLGSYHQNVIVQVPELVEALTVATTARDLPGMADVDASLYLFCQEIKKRSTVVLSGECADEVFGGYPWFHRPEMVGANTFPWSRFLHERMRFFTGETKELIRGEEYVADRYQQALNEVPRLDGEGEEEARIREIFYLNLTRWMPTLLDRKDRMSMAVGLEVRVPFCDHHLVEYVWNVPWSMKAIDGREKGLLRRALQGILPHDVLQRKKSPYPKTHNPDYLAAVRSKALHVLAERDSPVRQLIDKQAVKSFASQDLSNAHLPWFGQLMNVPQLFAWVMQLDQWMREYRVRLT
ncbi:asparagine synthase (glutamine-hydrolyzing) [Marininema halotolerans]|uniref:asparagine synthase (glutamine-hydrolyzing) n=1 Tax=Marininema halotolerans TaxID=1155944 RepID=A0A1I6PCR4_9BACL|nr:asparagine synthase (glutamine-hydrolyzing) [Marininema halotolerans]SFS37885.1 asparagine synthase (glutamine-hydrolysing) [Marininema halotolerans]